jgi:hypothetical protein
MNDITIIYLTQNLLPEKWNKYQQEILLKAMGDADLITVSRKPMNLPGINIIQTEPSSASNVYWQMLKAAKLATTKYIAVAEDDSIYCEDHFNHIPKSDSTFYYNLSHWSLFSWDPSMYSWRNRRGNWTLICNRELLIETLEERFTKYPDGTPPEHTGEPGRWRSDKQLGLTPRKSEDFSTYNPIININHAFGLDDRARRKWKRHGTLRALAIPKYGEPSNILKYFN